MRIGNLTEQWNGDQRKKQHTTHPKGRRRHMDPDQNHVTDIHLTIVPGFHAWLQDCPYPPAGSQPRFFVRTKHSRRRPCLAFINRCKDKGRRLFTKQYWRLFPEV